MAERWTPDQPVGCPFCDGRRGTSCCRCRGTKRVAFTWNLLINAWDVRSCPCDTCRSLRGRRQAIDAATRKAAV